MKLDLNFVLYLLFSFIYANCILYGEENRIMLFLCFIFYIFSLSSSTKILNLLIFVGVFPSIIFMYREVAVIPECGKHCAPCC